MKKSIERHAGNEHMLVIVLAIILCLTALWAIGCGGGNNDFRGQVLVGLSSNDPAPPTPGYVR